VAIGLVDTVICFCTPDVRASTSCSSTGERLGFSVLRHCGRTLNIYAILLNPIILPDIFFLIAGLIDG